MQRPKKTMLTLPTSPNFGGPSLKAALPSDPFGVAAANQWSTSSESYSVATVGTDLIRLEKSSATNGSVGVAVPRTTTAPPHSTSGHGTATTTTSAISSANTSAHAVPVVRSRTEEAVRSSSSSAAVKGAHVVTEGGAKQHPRFSEPPATKKFRREPQLRIAFLSLDDVLTCGRGPGFYRDTMCGEKGGDDAGSSLFRDQGLPSSLQSDDPNTTIASGLRPTGKVSKDTPLEEALELATELVRTRSPRAADAVMSVFRRSPGLVAAAGLLRQWVRMPQCDVTRVIPVLLQCIAVPYCEVMMMMVNAGQAAPPYTALAAAPSGPTLSSAQLAAVLRELHSIYLHPVPAVEQYFATQRYFHHQLFFRLCDVGVRVTDLRDLGAVVPLAAAVSRRLLGERLEMRFNLVRFLGKVEREWPKLVQYVEAAELATCTSQLSSLLSLAK